MPELETISIRVANELAMDIRDGYAYRASDGGIYYYDWVIDEAEKEIADRQMQDAHDAQRGNI